MKLLLTSGGVSNAAIRQALVGMLGKPISRCAALAVPTAQYAHPHCTPYSARRFVAGETPAPMCDLGWGSVGLLELTALPSVGRQRWEPWLRSADVLLVDGGDAGYLAHWLRRSGVAAFMAGLPGKVWVGVSAGSMALTPRIGDMFTQWPSPDGDKGLGLVNFSIFPHLDVFPDNSLAAAQRWAAEIGGEAYALDDQSAIRVVDGKVDVISEGTWRHFPG